MMNTEYRYQLESKRLTGHQPRKLTCPHCGKKKWSQQMLLTTGIAYNISPRLECYQPNTDLADLVLGEAQPP